jgi:hypothetical protein
MILLVCCIFLFVVVLDCAANYIASCSDDGKVTIRAGCAMILLVCCLLFVVLTARLTTWPAARTTARSQYVLDVLSSCSFCCLLFVVCCLLFVVLTERLTTLPAAPTTARSQYVLDILLSCSFVFAVCCLLFVVLTARQLHCQLLGQRQGHSKCLIFSDLARLLFVVCCLDCAAATLPDDG